MKRSKGKKEIIYKDMTLDSKPEYDFCLYLEELKNAGYIVSWNRGDSYTMTEGLSNTYTESTQLKTKVKVSQREQVLLNKSIYTPDFSIVWSRKAMGVFCKTIDADSKIDLFICDDLGFSVIEVKPSSTFDPNNMLRLFRLNQKFMWKIHEIFVNLVIPTDLFQKTFTPQGVSIPMDRKEKAEKWPRITLKQYTNG